MHPYHHAISSAKRHGGLPEDYLEVHQWFDVSKEHFPDFRHRCLRHHSLGIFECERVFGVNITNSAGKKIPTRVLGEQHVREDCGGRVPSVGDWLMHIRPKPWMGRVAEMTPEDSITLEERGASQATGQLPPP
jgi:hypothetical protein